MIKRDYGESPQRMVNGLQKLDDLDDYDVDEWFPEDESNDQD
jgi:hypothetical protein